MNKSHAEYAERNGKEWTDLERAYVFSLTLANQFRVDGAVGDFSIATTGAGAEWVGRAAMFMGRTPDSVAMKASNLIGVFRNELTWSSAPAESDFLRRWAVIDEKQRAEVVTTYRIARTADRSLPSEEG